MSLANKIGLVPEACDMLRLQYGKVSSKREAAQISEAFIARFG